MTPRILFRVRCADQGRWISIIFSQGKWEAQSQKTPSKTLWHFVESTTSSTAIKNNTWTF